MERKSLLLMTALTLCASMSAAELSVISTQKVDVADAYHPTLSPNGDVVLFCHFQALLIRGNVPGDEEGGEYVNHKNISVHIYASLKTKSCKSCKSHCHKRSGY